MKRGLPLLVALMTAAPERRAPGLDLSWNHPYSAAAPVVIKG